MSKSRSVTDKKIILYPIIAATISIIFLICIYAVQKIAPFGNNTIFLWDTKWQYTGFESWYHEVLQGNAYFGYSLRGELGMNTAGLFAYYLASPINLLLFFFNNRTLNYGIILMLLIKTGLSAASMQHYLYLKKNNALSIVFGCFYALSSYAICFGYNLMWMDAYYMLPLIILGIDRIIKENKGVFYAVCLGYSIMCNYYIGFMICLFCIVYYLCNAIKIQIGTKEKTFVKKTTTFILYSVLGGGLSFAIILPGVLTLSESSTSRILSLKDFMDFSLILNNPLQQLKYLFAGGFDANQGIQGTYPLLYAGSVTIFLTCAYFANKSVKTYDKICNGIILLILFVGMIFRGPFLIWHGFNQPSGCYERFVFTWIFIVLCISYEAALLIKVSNAKVIVISAVMTVLITVYVILTNDFRLSYILNVVLIVLSATMIIGYNSEQSEPVKKALFAGIVLLAGCELIYNAKEIHEVQFEDNYSKEDEYIKNIDVFDDFTSSMTDYDNEKDRAVIVHGLGESFNKGLLYNFNGIQIYASSETQHAWNTYGNLGLGYMSHEDQQEFDDHANGLIRNLLGVKYIIDYDYKHYEGLEEIDSYENLVLYKNDSALPLGFLVNAGALDIEKETDLFERMNRIYHSLYGATSEDAYTVIEEDKNIINNYAEYETMLAPRLYWIKGGGYTDGYKIAKENVSVIKEGSQNCAQNTIDITVDGTRITGRFNNEESDKDIYACFSISYDDAWKATVDGIAVDTINGMGGLILVPIPEGVHDITLSYHTKGLLPGAIISVICVLMIGLVAFKQNEKRN